MDQTLHQLAIEGLRPVVTHPERKQHLADEARTSPDFGAAWMLRASDGWVFARYVWSRREEQLFGVDRTRLVHFVSSDAHNITSRPLQLGPAFDFVRSHFGEEAAQGLFVDNPLAAFEGRTLPYAPEVADERPTKRRKRFFFLLGS